MYRWERRDRKLTKKKKRMPVSGRSVFIIQAVQVKRAQEAKEEHNGKES